MTRDELNRLFDQALDHQQGTHGPRDDVAARALYERSAAEGHPESCVNLAWLMEVGRGGPVDLDGARIALRRAAEAGDPLGQAHLGRLLSEYGDKAEGRRWLEAAAAEGHVWSAIRLADMDLGHPERASAAIKLLRQHADENPLAACVLADAYMYGDAVLEDHEAGVRLYEQAAAAGHADAKRKLAWVRLKAWDDEAEPTDADMAEAIELLEAAAEDGLFKACAELGELLAFGHYGITADPDRAVALLERGLFTGEPRPKGVLARLCFNGDAPAISPERAFALCTEATEEPHPGAHVTLAWMYRRGFGTRKDAAKARLSMQRAIELGYDDGQETLDLQPEPLKSKVRRWFGRSPGVP